MKDKKPYTIVGTDIEAVKKANEQSGMSYNEAKEWLARTTGERGTSKYSDTDLAQMKENFQAKKE